MAANQNPGTKFYGKAYIWFFVALAVIVAGFYNSFFSKLGSTDLSHHFHGAVSTLWLLLLIVQPWLYSRDKLSIHRKLGKISFVLAPLIIVSALMMLHSMLNSKGYPPLVPYRLAFLDFVTVILFAFFYSKAIVNVKDTQLHARYMAVTVLLLLPPGLGRLLFLLPGFTTFGFTLNIDFLIIEIVLLFLLWDDKRSGRIRPPYALAFLFFLFMHIGLNLVHHWAPWVKLMDAYARL